MSRRDMMFPEGKGGLPMVKRIMTVISLAVVFLGITVSCPFTSGAVTWGYPPGSACACVHDRYQWVIYPDQESAYEALKADCYGLPAYQYFVPQNPSCFRYVGFCTTPGCTYVANGCRDPVFSNGSKVYYYPVGVCPAPSQQPDPPITTEMADRNAGGECEGACNTTINDSSGGG
jgi:hypothetical protein